MIIYPGVDIEMSSLREDKPNQEEYVIVVLKQEQPQKSYTNWRKDVITTGNVPFSIVRVCRTKIYKGERVVFFDATGYYHERHNAEDIICWGRLKP